MKTEIKKRSTGQGYRFIVYPWGQPSVGFEARREDLYGLYVQLRDFFQDPLILEEMAEDEENQE